MSDTERQRAIDELRRHCAAGRIDVDEYARRIEQALVATTLEDLDQVRGDLPMLRIADPVGFTPAINGTRSSRALANSDDLAARRLARKVTLTALASITVVVLVVAVILAAAVSWPWAVLLVAGWAAGMVQGRLSAHRR
ncbi:MAG: DUF1707 SHOCT-like domain-containing protein [Acidimicrobiales bacterium]